MHTNIIVRQCITRTIGIMTLVGMLTISTTAQAVQMANVIPGMGSVDVKVKSVREIRYTNMIPQTYDFSCGAAAMATLLKYAFDQNVTEFSVLKGLIKTGDEKKIKQYGFSLLDLKKYAQAQGYQSTGFKIPISQLMQLKVPAIALIDVKGFKHFVVVKKVIDGKVYIADPALGNRTVALEDFSQQWNNIVLVVVGKDYDKNSILANPAPPISAKRLHGLMPTPNASPFDFGPGRNKLF